MANNGKKIAAGVGAAGIIAVSGAALANSQSAGMGSPNAQSGYGQQGHGQSGNGQQGAPGGQQGPQGGHGPGGHRHTELTGSTLTTVKNAVKAKDAAVSIEKVLQDPDGSYDVLGTKSGARVMVEVSKDLKTIDVHTGDPGGRDGRGPGGPGGQGGRGHEGHGPGGHRHGTEVNAADLAKVKAAVKAKDAAVTVEKAFKESDGTYRAFGTKSGARVMVELSKDLKTATVKAGMPGGPGGQGGHGPHGGFGGSAPSATAQGSGTSV